jgi:hypothetical protein
MTALTCAFVPVGGCAKNIVKQSRGNIASTAGISGSPALADGSVMDGSVTTPALAAPSDATVFDASRNAIRDSGTYPDVNPGDAQPAAVADGAISASGDAAWPDAAQKPVVTDCDLSGRWIATQRTINEALGGIVIQSGHSWIYYEFEQRNTDVVVKKGLQCGEEVKDHSTSAAFATRVTSGQALWDGIAQNNPMANNRASYALIPGSNQCQLDVKKYAVVRGATYAYFGAFDKSGFLHSINEASQPAQDATPGWEDWDGDGNAGVSYHISGIASGDVYMVQRDLLEYNGPTEKNASKFKLAVTRLHEQRTIGQNPATLPSADVSPSPDPAQHFIWFARVDTVPQWDLLSDADPLTICAKMREVKDILIPEGNE